MINNDKIIYIDNGIGLCPQCNREFIRLGKGQIRCHQKDCWEVCLENKTKIIKCIHCNEEFRQKTPNQKYCGNPQCKRKQKNIGDKRQYKNSIRIQMRYALKSSLSRPNMFFIKDVKDLPHSIEEYQLHLEKYFDDKMTWTNRGSCRSRKKNVKKPKRMDYWTY